MTTPASTSDSTRAAQTAQTPPPKPLALAERLEATPYDGYLYAYPHKTAYRPLDPPRRLADVWAAEDRRALSLYIHVPFCEMRCGFCNLFTTPRPAGDTVRAYCDALERQANRVRAALGDGSFARFAIGGGTPTLLDEAALARVLDLAAGVMGADLPSIPGSVETSPETCSSSRMRLLRDRGIDRVSIGVQSFVEAESAAVNRPQQNAAVFGALDAIRGAGFPVLNLDLMYGLPEQTLATWERSLATALTFRPEELYLYPLYVRPVTTLSRRRARRAWDDERLAMYRLARDLLLGAGYTQTSMRMFRAPHAPTEGATDAPNDDRHAGAPCGPVYCVQEDGMVGLGPGARSYTRALQWSTEWAVGARGVSDILGAWLTEDDPGFDVARWGFELDADEQRRRWIALALLVADGVRVDAYRARFGGDPFVDLPALSELVPSGVARFDGERLVLTELGLERSDVIGPWLYSPAVNERMRTFELR